MRFVANVSLAAIVPTCLLLTNGCVEVLAQERVDEAGAALRAHPDAAAAQSYAAALHGAADAHAYEPGSLEFQRRASEALAALTANQTTAGPDRPRLVAWRGVLLLDLGRDDEASAELQRSMAMRPTLVAARGILPLLHRQGRPDDVADACVRIAAAITDRDELYALIQLCAANAIARDEATGLAWMTPDERAFYDAERARRERLAEEAAEEAAQQYQMQAAADAARDFDDAVRAALEAHQAAVNAAMQATPSIAPPPLP
jgi:hypothetical protein